MKNIDISNNSVSAAELVRAFPQCRERAVREPLMITNHGRVTNVLLTVEQYEALSATSASADGSDGFAVRELAEWLDDAVVICGRDTRIEFANRVAHAICRKPYPSMNERLLMDVLPELSGSMVELRLRRTLVSSEPSSADFPSPFAQGAWLRVQTFPIGGRVAFVFRDISEEVACHNQADVKNALLDAMNCHKQIGYVRISVRSTIERIDLPFSDVLQLSQQQLIDQPLTKLIPPERQASLQTLLDDVIHRGQSNRTQIAFQTPKGPSLRVTMAIAPLHGAYGAEGAVLLVTLDNEARQ